MAIKHAKGQATIEALMVALGFVVVLVSLIFVIYNCVVHRWLQQKVYEATLCAVMKEPIWECQQHFTLQTSRALPFGHITQMKIYKKSGAYVGKATFTIGEQVKYEFEKSIPYPIQIP